MAVRTRSKPKASAAGVKPAPPEPRPSTLRVLVLASRPNTLAASLTPVVVGLSVARRVYGADCDTRAGLVFWVFACLIQIGTNLHNDYADFVKGADTAARVGPARATQKGWLTPRETARLAIGALVGASGVGYALAESANGGRWMRGVAVTSVFNAVAYTGGPVPLGYVGLGWVSLGYSGLGDVFVFVYFGLVATLAPFALARPAGAAEVPPSPALIALAAAVGCLATAIIVVNNLRDREGDVKAGKRTLAVRFGGAFARVEYAALVAAAYATPAALVASGRAPRTWLLPELTLPLALRVTRRVLADDGAALNASLGKTAMLQLAFGALAAVGALAGPPPPSS